MSESEGVSAGLSLSAAMGCQQQVVSARISCLRQLDVGTIFANRYALDQPGDIIPIPPATYMGYAAVIDAGYMPQGEAFLTDNPVQLTQDGE